MVEVLQLRWVAMLTLAIGCTEPSGKARLHPVVADRAIPVIASVASVKAANTAVIGLVRFRDAELVVHASGSPGQGMLFAVHERGRTMPTEVLTELELNRHFPDLYHQFQSAIASESVSLDASLDRRLIAPPTGDRPYQAGEGGVSRSLP